MNAYCLTLEVRSPLGTPLAADTLWGHIAWGIRWNAGEAALEEWLNRYDSEPPLVLSDLLPAGFVPRPALPPVPRGETPPTEQEANQRKQLAALRWLPQSLWSELAENLTPETLEQAISQCVEDGMLPPAPLTEGVVHAGVNRLTGGTEQPTGGSLFAVERTFYPEPTRFDLWVRSPEPLDTVRQWCEQGLAGGYGRDAATGAGHIVVVDAVEAALPSVETANAAVALGCFTPATGDPQRGFFRAGVRCGRLGGDFANGPLPSGATQRQKRPIAVFEAGTLLVSLENTPPVVGRVLQNVHELPQIRHYAITLLLPCRVTADVLAHPLILSPSPLQPTEAV